MLSLRELVTPHIFLARDSYIVTEFKKRNSGEVLKFGNNPLLKSLTFCSHKGYTVTVKNVKTQISVCMRAFMYVQNMYQNVHYGYCLMTDGLLSGFVFSNFPPMKVYNLSNIFKEEEKKNLRKIKYKQKQNLQCSHHPL